MRQQITWVLPYSNVPVRPLRGSPLVFSQRSWMQPKLNILHLTVNLFACCAGIRHNRYMLEGRPFIIFTDHKPLTFALHKVAEPWTARQSRQLAYEAEFTSDIRHVPGAENVVADYLSRPPSPPAVLSAVAA